jgi:dTDP-4-amino-4,6-dideoxygalactose transaminase
MNEIKFGEFRLNHTSRKMMEQVLNTEWISGGPMVERFENMWSEKFGTNSVAVSSGTDACICACLALYARQGVKRGDEIIVPALSFIATANAVRAAGFTPVFVDVRHDLNMDETLIEQAITKRTVAVMCVHTMGRMCDVNAIGKICNANNLIFIEDSCEAHGAIRDGIPVGEIGDMSCYSFYQAHIVNAGEGGMITTTLPHWEPVLRSVRSHGREGLYFDHVRVGYNSKMNDMEAAIGIGSMEDFDKTFSKRREIVSRYREACYGLEDKAWFTEERREDINCPHGFSITAKKPGAIDKLKKVLDDNGIQWKRNFGCIPTQHAAFADMGYRLGDFPVAEYIGDNGIHIGCHPFMSDVDVQRVCEALRKGLE